MNSTFSDFSQEPLEEARGGFSIQEYVSTLLRGKWVVLIALGAAVFIMAIYTLITRPVYESSSLVLVNLKQQVGAVSLSETPREAVDSKIANELAILKSRLLAEAVARALLDNPWADEAKRQTLPIVQVPATEGTEQSFAPVAAIASRLRRMMDFSPERESDVIRIIARSSDPRESAVLANIYAEVFQEHEMSITRTRSKSLREFLQNQVNSKKSALERAESELKTYMQASGVV